MKIFRNEILIAFLLISATHATADTQKVSVSTNDQLALVYTVDNGMNFGTADDCAKYCWNRSSSRSHASHWGNNVDIFFKTDFTAEMRQLVGDWFVANYVYPHTLFWEESGRTNSMPYKPSTDNLERIRRWRKEAPEPSLQYMQTQKDNLANKPSQAIGTEVPKPEP